MTSVIDTLFSDAFDRPRIPRSDEYKDGFRDGVSEILNRNHETKPPYPPGTAQADAWFSGAQEGADYARRWIKDHPYDRPPTVSMGR